jgi:hypothetical protein
MSHLPAEEHGIDLPRRDHQARIRVAERVKSESLRANRCSFWSSLESDADGGVSHGKQALGRTGEASFEREVTRFDASRYVTGTYLLLGDVLRLRRDEYSPPVS